MTADLGAALEAALERLPKKGAIEFPYKAWLVERNLHEWAKSHGYLTGAIFHRRRRRRGKTQARLLLVGPCPYGTHEHRWYTASIPPEFL
jgi:hypothetical protein